MRRIAVVALAAFAATMAVAVPRLPVVAHAAWADVAAAIAVLATALLILRRRGGERPRALLAGGATVAGMAYAGWIAVAAAAAGSGFWRALGAVELVGVMASAALLARLSDDRDAILRAWIGGAAVLAVVGLAVAAAAQAGLDVEPLFAGGGELGLRGRPAGLCRSGMLAAVALGPIVVVALDGKRLVGRRARLALLALLVGTMALTLTRTLLALPVASAIAAARRRPRLALATVVLATAAAIASVRIDVHRRGEPGIRWRIAASALERARAHPLVGIGPGEHAAVAGWPSAADPPLEWDAHSTVLDLAATVGLPGLALFLVTIGLAARAGWRASRDGGGGDATDRALRVALLATAFDALTIDVAEFRHVWLLAGLCAAACGRAQTAKDYMTTT
jgi:hypothetical protein